MTTKKLNVAFLCNHFPPVPDGVGDYTYHLAQEFQANGHSVAVLCRQHPAVAATTLPLHVAPIVRHWDWRAIRPLVRFLRSVQPDWLLVQYVPNGFHGRAIPIWMPVLVALVRSRGVRVAITFHEIGIRLHWRPFRYVPIALLQRGIAWALARLAHVCITSIDFYQAWLQAYTARQVHQIPISSSIQPVPFTVEEATQWRTRVGQPTQPIVATFGTRQQDELLRVFEEVLTLQPAARLLICGTKRLSAGALPLYERLQHQIHITGYLAEADVYRFLAVSDVFVLYEPVNERGEGGLSTKSSALAAALAAGLPVVGTRGDMNNVLLRHSDVVSLEESNNVRAMAQKIDELLRADFKTQKGQKIQAFYRKKFSTKSVFDLYSQVLHS